MSLPRLTGALRAFAVVDDAEIDIKNDDLIVKRLQKAKQQSESGVSWKHLSTVVQRHATDVSEHEIKDMLRELNCLAREMGIFMLFTQNS